MALLELKGVDALYGRVRALRGVTINVDQGEVVALIGSNGAGKTTTLRTISGLMHPPTGSISFNGKDISRMAAHDIVDVVSPGVVTIRTEGKARISPTDFQGSDDDMLRRFFGDQFGFGGRGQQPQRPP